MRLPKSLGSRSHGWQEGVPSSASSDDRISRRCSTIDRLDPLTRGVNQMGRHKDHQVALVVLLGLALEQASDEGKVAKNRHFVLNVLYVFADQTTQSHSLSIPDGDAGGH